ncbi:MAG: TatD family hydrolase [Candidatus Micrarchaeia archaeon]
MEQNQLTKAEFGDAHCHLNLFEDPRKAIESAILEGISTIVTAGGSNKDNAETAMLANGTNVYGVIGISPDFVNEYGDETQLEGLVKSSRNIVGIGEIGIDRKITQDEKLIEKQIEIFKMQLEVAERLEVPVVVHSRGALNETISILEEMSIKRVLFHFFEGDEVDAKRIEGLGYFASVPPIESSKRYRMIKALSLKSILLETDSPVVGKTPADVKKSALIVANAKGLGVDYVAEKTLDNLREFFYI